MKITGILSGLITGAMILSACSDKDQDVTTSTTSPSTTDSNGSANDTSGSADTEDTSASGDSATGTSGSASGTSQTTDPATTGSTGGTSGADTEDCSFLECDDQGGSTDEECDVWTQDCPEDEKCMPWANDGSGAWNATKCSPIDAAPQEIGDVCIAEGGAVSGVDNCVKSAMCWDVDPETNEGVCVGFCQGTPDAGTCDPGFICSIYSDGVLILCLPDCDPLLQDCPGDDLCIPTGDDFTCVLDASGEAGFYGDPCEYANVCKPGLYCLNPEYIDGCDAAGCCTPFCDLTEDNTCPGDSQECIPWYEEGTEPPGKENVGICGIPQ